MKKSRKAYHHGNLAESLLDAVDEIATKFGLEAVTLRACAKLVGVSPSAAFRHYADKRTLLTAFATRALTQLSTAMDEAAQNNDNAFVAVSLAYVKFALDKPAFFRAMWREEGIYIADEDYAAAARTLRAQLQGGFANTLDDTDAESLSAPELLAWSSVHGLSNLFVEGSIGKGLEVEEKLKTAREMIELLQPLNTTAV